MFVPMAVYIICERKQSVKTYKKKKKKDRWTGILGDVLRPVNREEGSYQGSTKRTTTTSEILNDFHDTLHR